MRVGLVAAALAIAAPAAAFEVGGRAAVRGWFFGAEGHVEDTRLDALDFDEKQGQPELEGRLTLARRHHVGISYLLVRRGEEGIARGRVLGVVPIEDRVAIDLDVDYLRGHYGFSVLATEWLDVEPFVEVGYLREATDVRNESTGDRAEQEDSAVFPLPGAEIRIAPRSVAGFRVRATGIATGQGHIVDAEGGVEVRYRFAFAGAGFRHVDFRVEDDGQDEIADLELDGFYVQGGVRF